jgi:AraC-like DNA-binding protein
MTKKNQVFGFSDDRNCSPLTEVAPYTSNSRLSILNTGCKRANQTVERSIDYMVANLNRPLRVATVAAQVNVSQSYFFSLFKQITGCPPMDYFTKLRMAEACRLLNSPTARVKEVAIELGYNDPFYFSRVFKSFSTVAPSHYRRLSRASPKKIHNLLDSVNSSVRVAMDQAVSLTLE